MSKIATVETGHVVWESETDDFSVAVARGDILEVWKSRDDGHHFVYSPDIELGYWVHPKLIRIISEEQA